MLRHRHFIEPTFCIREHYFYVKCGPRELLSLSDRNPWCRRRLHENTDLPEVTLTVSHIFLFIHGYVCSCVAGYGNSLVDPCINVAENAATFLEFSALGKT